MQARMQATYKPVNAFMVQEFWLKDGNGTNDPKAERQKLAAQPQGAPASIGALGTAVDAAMANTGAMAAQVHAPLLGDPVLGQ